MNGLAQGTVIRLVPPHRTETHHPPRAGAGGEIARRIAVAAVGIPLAVVLVQAGGWVLGGAAAAVAAGGAREVYRLAARGGVRPFTLAGCAAAALFPLAAAARPAVEAAAPLLWSGTVLLLLACMAGAVWRRAATDRPLEAAAVTVAASLFTGGTLSFLVFLRHLPVPWAHPQGSVALALFPLLLVWSADTAAFAAGRAFGGRGLTRVSPGKTRGGAVAGIAAAVAAGAALGAFLLPAGAGLGGGWMGAAAGLLAGAAGLMGDLAKSAWKREAGVKDSGRVLPGHGGILDRFDSTFFAVPVVYLLVVLLGALAPAADPDVEIGAAQPGTSAGGADRVPPAPAPLPFAG